jgi:hypothetical protein
LAVLANSQPSRLHARLRYKTNMAGAVLRAIAIASVFALASCDRNVSNKTIHSANRSAPKPAAQPPNGWRAYGDARLGFSIDYPEGWSVDRDHVYAMPVHDNRLTGVAFTVPLGLSTHTNLSSNSYLAVESVEGVDDCNASDFLDQPTAEHSETRGSQTWSVATMGDAGAGNFYDETVYALEGSKPCLAIRYFIHSMNISNYPDGTVRQFDHAQLVDIFDKIRGTFALSHPGTAH